MILGLDISLAETGWCMFGPAREEWGTISPIKGAKGIDRLEELDRAFRAFLGQRKADGVLAVVVEGYAFSAKGMVYQIGELGGIVRLILRHMNFKTWEVKPNTLKSFIAGKGNAKKDEMLLATFRRFGLDFAGNHNLSDAVGLAAMGCGLENVDFPRKFALNEVQKKSLTVPQIIIKPCAVVARFRTRPRG